MLGSKVMPKTPSVCVTAVPYEVAYASTPKGIPYVLDFEDEDSGMEVDADGVAGTAKGAATANGAGQSLDRPPMAGTEAAGEDLPLGPTMVSPDDASRITVAPEVAARLKEVLANMDPIYHEVFISMYKIMVNISARNMRNLLVQVHNYWYKIIRWKV